MKGGSARWPLALFLSAIASTAARPVDEPALAALRHPVLPPDSVTAGDVDGDGAPDLVAGLDFGRRLALLRGRGDGSFSAPEVVAQYTPPIIGRLPRLLHLDGDGDLDLLVLPDEIRLGRGDGTFAEPVPIPGFPGARASLFARADFDGDGRRDFVVEGRTGSPIGGTAQPALVVYLTRPDGSLEVADVPSVVFLEPFRAVAAGDFDGDGHDDVVSSTPDELRLHPGGGDGTFGLPAQVFAEGERIHGLAAGDFDEDGRTDLATLGVGSGPGHNQIALWHGGAGGTLTPGIVTALAASGTPPSFASTVRLFATDVDADGHLDLLALAGDVDALFFYRGAGDGTFPTRRAFFLGSPSTAPSFVDADLADFDGDGLMDLVVADVDDGAMRPFLGSRTGFVELGLALAGPGGVPRLRGTGSTVAREGFTLRLSYGAAGAPGLLVIGRDAEVSPFLGGFLGPLPAATVPFTTPFVMDSRWPSLLPGTPVYFQAWLADGGPVAGNVVAGVTTF